MTLVHGLSFDVEEYFQVANFADHFPRERWDEIPSRLDVGMDALLACLERRSTRATFFFLGWVAERRPDLVRRCLDGGHEIASHGYGHAFLQDLGPEAFEEELVRTEKALTDAGAPRPIGYRASTFTLTRRTWWAFDVLVRHGYRYDSSVHPIRHPTYGVPDFEPGISAVRAGDGEIVEFPVATLPFAGRNWPVGGGGYFRLLPGWVTRRAVARLERLGRPVALYLHPWEFDPGQPQVPAPWTRRLRHRLNLERTLARLGRLIETFRFDTMRAALAARGHRFE